MTEFISLSCEETEKIGRKFATSLNGNETVAMYGEIGAGKTSFVRGVCLGLGLKDDVASPTFSIVNEYVTGKFPVYHFDMYRIKSWDDLYSTGFFDYVGNGVLLIEWSENVEKFLPNDIIKIVFEKSLEDQDYRSIKFLNIEEV